jgi:hypothetical protein
MLGPSWISLFTFMSYLRDCTAVKRTKLVSAIHNGDRAANGHCVKDQKLRDPHTIVVPAHTFSAKSSACPTVSLNQPPRVCAARPSDGRV